MLDALKGKLKSKVKVETEKYLTAERFAKEVDDIKDFIKQTLAEHFVQMATVEY